MQCRQNGECLRKVRKQRGAEQKSCGHSRQPVFLFFLWKIPVQPADGQIKVKTGDGAPGKKFQVTFEYRTDGGKVAVKIFGAPGQTQGDKGNDIVRKKSSVHGERFLF